MTSDLNLPDLIEIPDCDVIQWHHKIHLPDGRVTPGIWEGLYEDYGLADLDFTGQRVLDIGCLDGQYSFYAERRGAAEVVSIDVLEGMYGYLYAHRALQSRCKYIFPYSVYDLDPKTLGTFDIVLFLGVLYHLKYPVLAVDKVNGVLNPGGIMVLESEISNKNTMFCHQMRYNPVDPQDTSRGLDLDIPLVELDGKILTLNLKDIYKQDEVYRNDPTNFWILDEVTLKRMIDLSGFRIDRSLPRAGRRMTHICTKLADPEQVFVDRMEDMYAIRHEMPRIDFSQFSDPLTNDADWYQNFLAQRFRPGAVPVILFPDWHQPEETLFAALTQGLQAVLSTATALMLVVEASDIDPDEAQLALSGAFLEILSQGMPGDFSEPDVYLVRHLSALQWQALLPHLSARLPLSSENQVLMRSVGADQLSLWPDFC